MEVKITNQPLQLTKKTSFVGSFFEAGFLVVLIIIAFSYLVSPKQAEYAKLVDTKETLLKQQEGLKAKEKVFTRLLQELEQEDQTVKSAETMLPLENQPSRVYILLESILQAASLPAAVVSVDIQAQKTGESAGAKSGQVTSNHLMKNSFSVSASGTIDQLDNLLKLLEISSRLIQVKSVDVSQGSNDQVLFKVNAESYAYLPVGL